MVNIILFDDEVRDHLLPLTYTKPVGALRIGILTIKEKWERWMNANVSFITQDYLAGKYPIEFGEMNYVINGSVLPSPQLVRLLQQMDEGTAFLDGDNLIATRISERKLERLIADEDFGELRGYDLEDTEYLKVNRLWDLYRLNGQALQEDFELLTKDRKSQTLSSTNQVLGRENIFVEEGASVEFSILNAQTGPIYIGKNAKILEGCMVRGGLAMGEGAIMKMGAKVYGATTIGPYSKVGGEVNNSVIQAYSNKGHDGYLGNSVLGEWCNLGADTNNSNLKNNYGEVKLWNYPVSAFLPSGQQFCGLFMGDHSKCGINTMFNTGTVVGTCSNIFGGGFPPKFIPSFSWGGHQGLETFQTDKAFEMMERMMARRKVEFSVQDRIIMLRIFEETTKHRPWEKTRGVNQNG